MAEIDSWLYPTGHAMHGTEETVEYFPASHLVQLLLPGLLRVSVLEPAEHTSQPVLPSSA